MSASALATLLAAAQPAGAQPAWAHQSAGFQSNGAIAVKSLAGVTFGGSQNPAGAVAKANQTAVTQPPTVIIQATGTTYAETIPLVAANTLVAPACPSGYSVLWAASGTGIPTPVVNIKGSRWSWGSISISGGSARMAMFFADSLPTQGAVIATSSTSGMMGGGNSDGVATVYNSGTYFNWAATLCAK